MMRRLLVLGDAPEEEEEEEEEEEDFRPYAPPKPSRIWGSQDTMEPGYSSLPRPFRGAGLGYRPLGMLGSFHEHTGGYQPQLRSHFRSPSVPPADLAPSASPGAPPVGLHRSTSGSYFANPPLTAFEAPASLHPLPSQSYSGPNWRFDPDEVPFTPPVHVGPYPARPKERDVPIIRTHEWAPQAPEPDPPTIPAYPAAFAASSQSTPVSRTSDIPVHQYYSQTPVSSGLERTIPISRAEIAPSAPIPELSRTRQAPSPRPAPSPLTSPSDPDRPPWTQPLDDEATDRLRPRSTSKTRQPPSDPIYWPVKVEDEIADHWAKFTKPKPKPQLELLPENKSVSHASKGNTAEKVPQRAAEVEVSNPSSGKPLVPILSSASGSDIRQKRGTPQVRFDGKKEVFYITPNPSPSPAPQDSNAPWRFSEGSPERSEEEEEEEEPLHRRRPQSEIDTSSLRAKGPIVWPPRKDEPQPQSRRSTDRPIQRLDGQPPRSSSRERNIPISREQGPREHPTQQRSSSSGRPEPEPPRFQQPQQRQYPRQQTSQTKQPSGRERFSVKGMSARMEPLLEPILLKKAKDAKPSIPAIRVRRPSDPPGGPEFPPNDEGQGGVGARKSSSSSSGSATVSRDRGQGRTPSGGPERASPDRDSTPSSPEPDSTAFVDASSTWTHIPSENHARQGLLLLSQLGGNASSGEVPRLVSQFDDAVSGPLGQFLALSNKIGGETAKSAKLVEQAFAAQREFLWTAQGMTKAAGESKLQSLLGPTSERIGSIQALAEANRRSGEFNHLSALSEGVPALGWVTVSPAPAPFVKEMSDAAQFYTNRVLKDWKDKDSTHVDWVKAWLGLLEELRAYVKANHTTGLEWNTAPGSKPSGGGAAKAPAPPAGGGPPPPPPPPPADLFADLKKGGGGGQTEDEAKAALFADINKGLDITKSLKKVTDDMKTHKNPELRTSSVVPSGPPKPAPKPPHLVNGSSGASAASGAKQPVTALEGKKWVVEYHKNNRNIIIEATDMKQVVYIWKCENSVIQIKGKVNSVTMDSCKKTSVVFDSLVSQMEIINSQSVQVQSMGAMPTLAIQKTDGCQVYLSKESVNAEIVTSKSSEMNILVPTPDGDFKEFAVPEQYKTVFTGKGLDTVVVDV